MTSLKELQAGHFLTYELWDSAKKLLDYQINDKPNYNIYNTLNFYYFDKIKKLTKRTSQKSYYKNKIANNLYYGLEREFFFHKYTIPKTGIGLRNYCFFSYPMQQLMYAFGLYLLRVTQQFIIDKKDEKIQSFYGADLKFNEATKYLVLNKNTTLYYKHYKNFKKELTNETSNPENKVVIFLDIQNYYDNISISKLLNKIEVFATPSDLKAYEFESSTKEQIEFFFKFLGNGCDNIPQSNNNIVSNFISNLYLIFGDLIIQDTLIELNKKCNIVNDYKIIRYVDDIYLAIDFKEYSESDPLYTEDIRNGFIYQLLNKIADDFYRELNLRFNDKAELFIISQEEEKKQLIEHIKKVSEDYPEPESDRDTSVAAKVNRLLVLIEEIKARDVSQVYKDLERQESETLKDVYDKAVYSLLSTKGNIDKLEEKFEDFNFDLLRVYPQPLIIMITLCPKAGGMIEDYLLSKKHLTTFDRELLVVLLCQTGFKNKDLFNKLKADQQLKAICEFMKFKKVVDDKNTGYYQVEFKNILPLTKEVSFIEQIRQRVYNEKQLQYSVALNHLLNEIQLACCILEEKDIKKYKEPELARFLAAKGLDNETRTKISNLFDRRNNNPVSHPGSDSKVAWAVEESEYYDYKESVSNTIESII